jgi:hypothetical protein
MAGPVSTVAAQTEAHSLVAASSAQGIRVTYTVPDLFVVSQFADGGGPVAQANVDTTGKSIGFASLPYPGENAVTAPGLLSFLSGAPIPPYPFYARADHPTAPSAEVKDPGGTYVLSAKADQGKVVASANLAFGGVEKPVAHSTADTSGVIDADRAKVSAVAVNEALSFGDGLLRIASVTSRSISSYTGGSAKPETKAELVIEGARVGDQSVTIGPDGVHPNGQTVPVPFGQGPEALNQALAQAGITVRTIASQPVESGAASEILEITVKHPVPGADNVKGTLVYQVGGSSSYIAVGDGVGAGLPSAEPVLDSGASTPEPAAAPLPGSPVSSADPGTAGAASSAALMAGGGERSGSDGALPFPGASSASPEMGAGSGVVAPSTTQAPLVGGAPARSGLVRDFRTTTRPLFAILAVGGVLLLASSALWRTKGVQASWTP